MKYKSLLLVLTISILYGCGPKVDSSVILNETRSYISKIENNKSLKSEVTEGALADTEGINDVGSFKYTVYFDENAKELFKISNIEMTDKTITETYYFQDDELVYLKSVSGNEIKNIYLKKERVISETNTTSDDQRLLLSKAKRFQKAFKETH